MEKRLSFEGATKSALGVSKGEVICLYVILKTMIIFLNSVSLGIEKLFDYSYLSVSKGETNCAP